MIRALALPTGGDSWRSLRTFNVTHHYQGEDGPVVEDVVLVLDADSGAVVRSWGSGRFLLPHGVTVDQRGNTWLTDVGLHQVFKVNVPRMRTY